MRRVLYTPSSTPVTPEPGPLLLFIQRAQLALVYTTPASPQGRLGAGPLPLSRIAA